MKTRRTTIKIKQFSWLKQLVLVLVVLSVGAAGVRFIGGSSAATYNHGPIGAANSCNLVNGKTVIYGWAHDPDAPAGPKPTVTITVGSTTTTVNTDIAGYRDATINNHINSAYPGMPTSSIYGFQLTLSGLYKGTAYKISGNINNVGDGADRYLVIDTAASVDDGGKPFFNGDNTLPDACLAAKPVTPPPVTAPPVTGGASTGSGSKSTGTGKAVTPVTPTSTPADAQISAGTVTASVQLPADGASSLHILYGTDPSNLTFRSGEGLTNGTTSNVSLTNLLAKTTYTYVIVRTINNQAVTSATNTFTTKGFVFTLHFVNADGKAVSGVSGSLGSKKVTSDKNGNLSFSDVKDGVYTVKYVYKGKTYSQQLDSGDAIAKNSDSTAVVLQDIKLDKVAVPIGTATKHQSHAGWWLLFLLLLVAAALIFFFLRRRRNQQPHYATTAQAVPRAALPQVQSTPAIDPQLLHLAKHPPKQEPKPAHMGQSLAQMVLESMRDEASPKTHQNNEPK